MCGLVAKRGRPRVRGPRCNAECSARVGHPSHFGKSTRDVRSEDDTGNTGRRVPAGISPGRRLRVPDGDCRPNSGRLGCPATPSDVELTGRAAIQILAWDGARCESRKCRREHPLPGGGSRRRAVGYVAAIRAAQLGPSVTTFEEKRWDGACLNVGCAQPESLLRNVETAYMLTKDAARCGNEGKIRAHRHRLDQKCAHSSGPDPRTCCAPLSTAGG
ncbi:hypothetical protein ABH922_004208 [Rhodococcus sp. 27YEA15]